MKMLLQLSQKQIPINAQNQKANQRLKIKKNGSIFSLAILKVALQRMNLNLALVRVF